MFANRISQTLHDEHRATIALIQRLEQLIKRRQGAPRGEDAATAQFLRELSEGAEAEVRRHFDFEENYLFAFLETLGDQAIGAHLTDEHAAMRPLGQRIASIARAAESAGFTDASWEEFRRIGREFVERMLVHVQKEEMALLPLLEDAMDSETEARLYNKYVAKG
jgi:hemerythrin-like domain-containing protein